MAHTMFTPARRPAYCSACGKWIVTDEDIKTHNIAVADRAGEGHYTGQTVHIQDTVIPLVSRPLSEYAAEARMGRLAGAWSAL